MERRWIKGGIRVKYEINYFTEFDMYIDIVLLLPLLCVDSKFKDEVISICADFQYWLSFSLYIIKVREGCKSFNDWNNDKASLRELKQAKVSSINICSFFSWKCFRGTDGIGYQVSFL